jgi:hypothetical protein
MRRIHWVAVLAVAALRTIGGSAATAQVTAGPPTPFVWEETTHVADAGWGRMTPLYDSKRGPATTRQTLYSLHWLFVCTHYPRPNSVLALQTSDDGGHTWKPGATIREAGRNLDNGEVMQLPDGTVLLTGRSVVESHTPGATLSYHLPVYRSTDGGASWVFVSQIDTSEPAPFQPGRPSLGLWEPHFFLLPDGRVACQYANEKHASDKPIAYSQVVSERVSTDGGTTWGPEITVASQTGGGGQRPGMPVVTWLPDGHYYAVYEVVGIGNADVYGKSSLDGITWPPGIGTPIPDQHAGPFVATLSDGRLVVSSCSNRISVSDDAGATWHLTIAAFPIVSI